MGEWISNFTEKVLLDQTSVTGLVGFLDDLTLLLESPSPSFFYRGNKFKFSHTLKFTPISYEQVGWSGLDREHSNQELEIWVKAGLVPIHLLDPTNHIDLINFLRINKEKLHACYQRNPEEDYYQLQVPPPNEWHNAPDIPVIDTRTGKVLYSLEMAGEFELCEGVCLRIKAKELEDWKKETAEAKQLTDEQNKELGVLPI